MTTDHTAAPVCSAKGCRAAARFAVRWRNPRLHTTDRVKTWVACPDHRQYLAGYLDARGFLLAVEPLGDGGDGDGPA